MTEINESSALVLFSGGQDSATCLAWALERYSHVETIGFDYGQRHSIELEVRQPIRQKLSQLSDQWAQRLGGDLVVQLDVLKTVSQSALFEKGALGLRPDGLPSTFVPGRNIVFLTFAGIVAKQRGLKTLVTGTCETDFSGYPDCRDDTIKALQVALNLGMEARVNIETPLMWIDKAATWAMAEDLGGPDFVDVIREYTHTCYEGDRDHRHAWGYGCGTCDACLLRLRGWNRYTATPVPG